MSTDTEIKTAGLPPRMLMKRTVSYRVHVRTSNRAEETLIFNVEPTTDLIAEALWLMKVGMPPVPDEYDGLKLTKEGREIEQKRYEQVRSRYENLIALVKIAEVKIPEVKESSTSEIAVAGVPVGHVSIQAREAWTVE